MIVRIGIFLFQGAAWLVLAAFCFLAARIGG